MEFRWKNYNWRVGHPWGICHPNHLKSWFGDDAVVVGDKIELKVIENPREFFGDIHRYSCGLITGVDEFSYGEYEIEAKLPTTPNSWASLWTCSFYGDWLHEVDICEAEADVNGGYNTELFRGKIFRNSYVTTNFHYKDSFLEHHQVGPKGIGKCRFINKIDIDDYNTYGLSFTPEKIEIYVNNISVRTLKDKKIMSYFNHSPYFYFIFNQDISLEFSERDYEKRDIMMIRNFKKLK